MREKLCKSNFFFFCPNRSELNLYIIPLKAKKGGKCMFSRNRYATARVSEEVPFELQLFMWMCIDGLGSEPDYLQVFELMYL